MVIAREPTRADRQAARPHRLAVQVHGAGAAKSRAAAELGPGEVEDVAKDPEERHLGRNVQLEVLSVDF